MTPTRFRNTLNLSVGYAESLSVDEGWYYVENQAAIGPVDTDEISALIAQGKMMPSTLVWRDGMPEWAAADGYFEFPRPATTLPPVISRTSQDTSHPAETSGDDGLYPGAPGRGFLEAVSVCFRKFVTFSGRASRSEYWYFILFTALAGFVTALIDIAIFGTDNDVSPLNSLVSLIIFLPSLAVSWRRLHDTNRSGWWIGGFWLAMLVAGIGAGLVMTGAPEGQDAMIGVFGVLGIAVLIYSIVLLVLFCTKGDPGPNRFG